MVNITKTQAKAMCLYVILQVMAFILKLNDLKIYDDAKHAFHSLLIAAYHSILKPKLASKIQTCTYVKDEVV